MYFSPEIGSLFAPVLSSRDELNTTTLPFLSMKVGAISICLVLILTSDFTTKRDVSNSSKSLYFSQAIMALSTSLDLDLGAMRLNSR